MRLKNVKGAKEKNESSKYTLLDYKNYKNNFKQIFNNDNPIMIEIGMGKGNFIIENAIQNPNINYIGIEKYDSVFVRAIEKLEEILEKLEDTNIPNLKLIRMDALEIDEVFSKEIDTIYLNFSDPWPKNRHEHRRLTSEVFLKKYDSIFKNTKHIIMKTDNRKLFEYSIMSLTNYGYKIEKISLDLYNDDISKNIPTEYEIKFHNKGFNIYMIEVYK